MNTKTIIVGLCVAMMGVASFAAASTPFLSLATTGAGDIVQINVTGADANASVLLNYNKIGFGPTTSYIGTTNNSGYLSVTVSSATYNIQYNSSVYVTTGGTSGPVSNVVPWPINSANTNNLVLTPGAVLLTTNQFQTVTANASLLYISSNPNSSVATVGISGNQINVLAVNQGSTIATICTNGNSSNCQTLYILVRNSGAGTLSFSQNNLTLSQNQSTSLTISGGTSNYSVYNNSNSAVVQATINNQTLTLTANTVGGSSSLVICSSDGVTCGVVTVTVNGSNSNQITFGNSNPQLSVGQTLNVPIYGVSSGNFYVSSNSNPGAVQITNSGTSINLYGNATGNATITVCLSSSTSVCNSLYVTVGTFGGTVSLSQNNVSLAVGQSVAITVSGGSLPYTISGNNNIFSSYVNGNTITVTGLNAGYASASVCAYSGGCIALNITVTNNNSYGQISVSPSAISLTAGQTSTAYVSGGGNYYIASSDNPSVASVSLNQNTVTVSGLSGGVDNVQICQNGGQCTILTLTIPQTTPNGYQYAFTRYMGLGSSGPDVLALQQILTQDGFLYTTPDGYYGASTVAAVKMLQRSHGLPAVGRVGPATLNLLNNLAPATTIYATTKQQQLLLIAQQIQALQAQLTALQAQGY